MRGPPTPGSTGWAGPPSSIPTISQTPARGGRRRSPRATSTRPSSASAAPTAIYRWHIVRAVPQRDAGGAILQWIGTNTDIDDGKLAEIELGAAKVAAEEANRAKSTFIANMSHELRTPLSAIIGYAEMLSEEIEDGVAAADLAPDLVKVESNARHLLGLINDVLDLSKVESGKMEAYPETFDLRAIVADVGATVTALVEKKSNRFVLDLGARRRRDRSARCIPTSRGCARSC